MKTNSSAKQTLRSAEIVVLGSVEDLTKGIEIGNLKDQSRVGWRPWTIAEGTNAPAKPKSKKRPGSKKKKVAAKPKKAKKSKKK